MIHPRDASTNRFPIFEELNPNYSYDSLLDFGGNQGNLLHFSNGLIPEEKYTSIDVSRESLQLGQSEFKKGNFVWWDRYNEMYNHTGKPKEPLSVIKQHDYIWAYSVFSHMIYEDILEALLWMKTIKPNKVLTSYLCNDGDENSQKVLQYFYDRRINQFGSTVDFRYNLDDYFYLSNNKYGVKSAETFIAVYNTEWLINKLYEKGIVAKKVTSSLTSIPFLEVKYEN